MSPELRSASIDICLPGSASRVKRAVTSEMRTAPWLITTYWIAISTRKITTPMM
jgi:chemotaxis protein MotB